MEENLQELNYSVVPHQGSQGAVIIESGVFNGFKFTIENLRLVYKDVNGELQLVNEETDSDELDIQLDFSYDLVEVPETYESRTEDKKNFEGMLQSIVLDVLMNHKNLYQLGANEHQTDTETTHHQP